MSSTAFDLRGLHVVEVASQPLEALVAQDNLDITSAGAAAESNTTTVVDIANAVVVTDETYGEAERYLVQWKLSEKDAHAKFDPICKSADLNHKLAVATRSQVLAPFQEAGDILSRKLAHHLAAKQRAQQEAERLRLEQAKLQALQQHEADIEQAEAAGASAEEVAALVDMPLPVLALTSFPARRPTQTASPVSLRTVHKARLTNHLELVRYIAGHPTFINLIPVDQTALNRLAASLKTTLMLPGVEVYTENTAATRTAARRA